MLRVNPSTSETLRMTAHSHPASFPASALLRKNKKRRQHQQHDHFLAAERHPVADESGDPLADIIVVEMLVRRLRLPDISARTETGREQRESVATPAQSSTTARTSAIVRNVL